MIVGWNKNRSRQIVLGAVTLIVAGQLISSWLIDRAPLAIRFPEAARVVDSLVKDQEAKTVVFFGTSRTAAAISASAVTQAMTQAGDSQDYVIHNAAVPAGDPIAIRYLNDRLGTAGIRPSVAVIEVLPETLSHVSAWMGFHIERQYRWPDILMAVPDAWRGGRFDKMLFSRLYPLSLFRYQFQLWLQQAIGFNLKKSPPTAAKKDRPTQAHVPPEEPPADLTGFRARIAKKRVRAYKIGGAAARNLELLLERFRQSQTEVILLSLPLPAAYRIAYQGEVEAQFKSYIQQLQMNFGLKYYDYRSRMPDELFRDSYYLKPDGRTAFSRLVAAEVLQPRLLSRERTSKAGGGGDHQR